jgi:hypothetical protein
MITETIPQRLYRLYMDCQIDANKAIERLRGRAMGLTLQRGLGESSEAFLARCPAIREELAECAATVTRIQNEELSL